MGFLYFIDSPPSHAPSPRRAPHTAMPHHKKPSHHKGHANGKHGHHAHHAKPLHCPPKPVKDVFDPHFNVGCVDQAVAKSNPLPGAPHGLHVHGHVIHGHGHH